MIPRKEIWPKHEHCYGFFWALGQTYIFSLALGLCRFAHDVERLLSAVPRLDQTTPYVGNKF